MHASSVSHLRFEWLFATIYLSKYNAFRLRNDMLRREFVGLSLALYLLPWVARGAESADSITVFAASSLTDVMQELSAEYTKATGTKVELSFAATSILARQIESG